MAALTKLTGVGKKRAELLEKLGLFETEDLLRLYPRRYEDRSVVVPIREAVLMLGETVSINAAVTESPRFRRIYGGRTLTTVTVADASGSLNLSFYNNPYIADKLKEGRLFNFYGRMDPKQLFHMVSPRVEELKAGSAPAIDPVYPLVSGLKQGQLRSWLKEILNHPEWMPADPLPQGLLEKYDLLPLCEALPAVHCPKTMSDVVRGRRRLIFEELLYFQLGLQLFSRLGKDVNRYPVKDPGDGFRALHSFAPTESQRQAVAEILEDMAGPYAMNRLLQGDVGSGKTFVAGEAAYGALTAGWQVAIMAPTEILARQHAEYFKPLLEKLGYSVALLVGSTPAAEKKKIYAGLRDGSIRVAIGTHALVQKQVDFKELGLVIADEQHRFGVRQRAALAAKGQKPHILVMSATPIPRTMALMVWGDLNLSVLEGMPSGRKQVETYLVDSGYKKRLRVFLQKQLNEGNQAYIVCPLVEESEESDLKSAEALFEELRALFGEKVDLIHGKMKAAMKEEAMNRFVAGETGILISTTVIEVGINVPNATVMILENAERFGLSQLHQLRGRVGRGHKQSYCILISDHAKEKTAERLEFFCSTNDGFAIANKDLELRGPGDFFGDLQHGQPKMAIADQMGDLELLTLSNRCAQRILRFDPQLESAQNQGICQNVERLYDHSGIAMN